MLPTLLRIAAWALALVLAAVLLYLAGAALGSLWAVNRHRHPPPQGIDVWLRSNGVHVDLILPVSTAERDWRDDFPLRSFGDPPRAPRWVAFGWGARDFFVNVREWKDLTAGAALRALMRAPTVLHVEYVADDAAIGAANAVRKIIVTRDEHAFLVRYVHSSLALDPGGRPQLLPGMGYSGNDNFYEGAGNYTPIATCNEWVNGGLKGAGLPAPLWSPFAWGLVRG